MLFNKKSEIDDLFDFNGVKMKTFTQWNRLRHGPMERTEIMKNVTLKDVAKRRCLLCNGIPGSVGE